MIYHATIFFTEELFCTNKILYVLKPVSEMCSRYFTKSHDNVSLVLFHFTSMKFTSITRMPIFFRFQDVCFRFVFQSIKMMYPLGTTPFPSLWRHQMKCLLISERIFFLKLGSNTLTINACSTVNILRNGPSSARNIPIILSLLKFNLRSVYCWCSMDSFCRVRFDIGPL